MAARSSLPDTENPPEKPVVQKPADDGCLEFSKSIEVIRKRPDFLAANRGKRFVTPGFILLAHKRREDHTISAGTIRYGITVTKKIGNAVVRNRMKRRFRALLAAALPEYGIAGVDHIMIGRKQGTDKNGDRDFAAMQGELEKGLKHLAKKL